MLQPVLAFLETEKPMLISLLFLKTRICALLRCDDDHGDAIYSNVGENGGINREGYSNEVVMVKSR